MIFRRLQIFQVLHAARIAKWSPKENTQSIFRRSLSVGCASDYETAKSQEGAPLPFGINVQARARLPRPCFGDAPYPHVEPPKFLGIETGAVLALVGEWSRWRVITGRCWDKGCWAAMESPQCVYAGHEHPPPSELVNQAHIDMSKCSLRSIYPLSMQRR